MDMNLEKRFLTEALNEANIALGLKEVPVGAVIVKDNKIIAKAHNLKETLNDPTAHAEILAIRKACQVLGNWRLSNCSMYVTLEPCPMCSGAIVQSRITDVFIGAFDHRVGSCGSFTNILEFGDPSYRPIIHFMHDEYSRKIINNFFAEKR